MGNKFENGFKIEKTKDYLIIWRKQYPNDKWFKWQNIPAKSIKNFKQIKIKGGK